MVPMLIDWRFLRVPDGTTWSTPHSSNHSEGEASLKICMRTSKRFRKSKRFSSQEKLKELYNIECDRQAAQS